MPSRYETDKLAAEFVVEHPTLQQEKLGVWLRCIYMWVEEVESQEGPRRRIDARNEVAYDRAKKIVDTLGEHGWMMPYI